jgi:hypothetical protein
LNTQALREIKTGLNIIQILAITTMIGVLLYLLTGEITGYFIATLGKSKAEAILWAWAFALLVPVLTMAAVKGFWPGVLRCAVIALIVSGQIYAASRNASEPLINKASPKTAAAIAALKDQLGQMDAAINKMPENWITRRNNMIAERGRVAGQLAAVSQADTIPTVWHQASILHTFTARGILEISIILLSGFLKIKFAQCFDSQKIAGGVTEYDTPNETDTAPKFGGMKPKEYVQTIHNGAICRKSGAVMIIYPKKTDLTPLGAGPNASLAWANAARNLDAA